MKKKRFKKVRGVVFENGFIKTKSRKLARMLSSSIYCSQGAIMDITAAMRNNSEIANLNTFNAENYLK